MITITDQTKRIILIYKQLAKKGDIKSQAGFSRKIDYHRVSLNHVLAGKRNFPESLIGDLCRAYDINSDYIYTGKAPMFLKPEHLTFKVKDFSLLDTGDKLIITFTDQEGSENIIELIHV
jgi:hypothetical protein